MVFLSSLSPDSLARNKDGTATTCSFIWNGDLSHGWNDSLYLSLAAFPSSWRPFSSGLVVCFSSRCLLDPLFYQDPCHGPSKSHSHSKLDRSLCGDRSGSLDLPSCRPAAHCLSCIGGWFWLDLPTLSSYLY